MASMDRLLRHRQTKEAETDRPTPNDAGACPLLYLAPEAALQNSQFLRPMTNGLMDRSAALLSISMRPSSR